MISLTKTGHFLYGLGIIAYGIQQIIIRDFRPQILPGFPGWVHQYSIFAIVTGIIMILTGCIISGLVYVAWCNKRRITLYLGFYFFLLLFISHLPYLLFIYPHKLSHLGSWGDALKELAFSGGAFVMAGSMSREEATIVKASAFDNLLEHFIPFGRIFFCTTIILFGCNHFVYDISGLVPKWFGMPAFWSYFGGAALIAAGASILLKIYYQPVALLLALMLFLWFFSVHLPNAIAQPTAGRGNSIVSAFDALLFCGIALVIAQTKKRLSNKSTQLAWATDVGKKGQARV